jgi:deaminated glutathione amidase
MAKLTLATCQFPISADIRANARHVRRQMQQASRRGARIVHFSECCLSGYAGIELESPTQIDWALLREETETIMALAGELGVWVALGSTHPLTGDHKPHNSLYVIDDQGALATRYDKLFCTGRVQPEPAEDLAHYSPGSEFVAFTVDGVRIGVLICHDFRYPELYRVHVGRGVQLMLHSYHNAGMAADRLHFYHENVTFTMRAAAASNHVWISANNGSHRYAWSSFVVNPAGDVVGRLRRHRAGVLVTEIDTEIDLWDASVDWRARCIAGVLHSGELVEDPRSDDRQSL